MLLLGAGFSIGAVSDSGIPLMLGKGVTDGLYNDVLGAKLPYMSAEEKEDCEYYRKRGKLIEICDVIRRENLVAERNKYFCKIMSGCKAIVTDCTSPDFVDFEALTTYPWPFIFTLNVDDLVENIYTQTCSPFTVWVKNSREYKANPEGTTIVKLHGCVKKDIEHFVFCSDEYNQFIRPSNVLLERFSNEAFTRDVIVVGTQFQERDLKNTVGTLVDEGCSGKDCHFFFISPGEYDKEVSKWINEFSNFHHIKWKNNEFLDFLRKRIRVSDSKKNLLTGNYFTCWNDEIEDARIKNEDDHELYYGRRPLAKDFFFRNDIERISDDRINVNKDFEEKVTNGKSFISIITGNTYVGKTCLGLRLLSICANQGITSYYTRRLDYDAIQRVAKFVESADSDSKLAFCFEDAAGCYHNFSDLISNGKRIKQFVIIAIAEKNDHNTKSHNLDSVPGITEYHISEKVVGNAVHKIYSKLSKKNQLGVLQKDLTDKKMIMQWIKNNGDMIDVLYFAHSGSYFLDHFKNWYAQKKGDKYLEVFKALVIFAYLGANRFTPTLLIQLSDNILKEKFVYNDFMRSFHDYIIEEDGRIRLHGTRLLSDIVRQDIEKQKMLDYIVIFLRVIGGVIRERDNSNYSLMFENVAKAKQLLRVCESDIKECIFLLNRAKSECEKLSYYWIQLSILFREDCQFEEAVNAINTARTKRRYDTYQIVHADAKNYMAWGLNDAKNGIERFDNNHFETGKQLLKELIKNKSKYPGAFGFSIHTYVNMTIQFYKIYKEVVDSTEWFEMECLINEYVSDSNYNDKYMQILLDEMIRYAKKSGVNPHAMIKAKCELKAKPGRLFSDYGEY